MGIKGIENVGILPSYAYSDKVILPKKDEKQSSELPELLSNSLKQEKESKSFFEENKGLLIGGGLLAAAVMVLVTKRFDSSKGVKGLFTGIFTNPQKKMLAETQKLVSETKDFISKETELFYSKTRSASQIFDFEKNKAILSDALNISPKEFYIKHEDYKNFIEFLRAKGLQGEISVKELSDPNLKYLYGKLYRECSFDWKQAEKIYYGQKELLNPDLSKIKAQISPRKVAFDADEERIFGFPSQGYTQKEVKKMLAESKDLTLDSGSFLTKSSYRDEIYDMPFKFASASYNSLAKNGNAYIKTEIPEIFKGIDEKELFESLDLLSTHIRGSISMSFPKNSVLNIKIGEKTFKCTSLGSGMEGSVYRISAEGQTPVVLKTYFASNDHSPFGVPFAPAGMYGGLGILREANMAKVVDVQRLYMANSAYIPIEGANSRYMGAWQLTEDANCRTVGSGLTFRDWLKSKKLYWADDKEDAFVNGICVDTGFIMNNTAHKYLTGGWGSYNLNFLYSHYLNGETTQQILDLVSRV